MKNKLVSLVLGALLLLMVVSCTVPSTSEAEANAPADGNEEAASTATVTGEVHTVAIENFQFMPTDVEAKVWDSIVWTNKDSTAHTVTEKGMISYSCQFHPSMSGTVQVN